MPFRWLAACAFGLLTVAGARAQMVPPCADCPPRPVELPPLLIPPVLNPDGIPPLISGGPGGDYDHGYLYLPDAAPPSAPETCRPLGRWWVSPALELAWLPSRAAPTNVRLRVPNGMGGTIPGPILPVAGLAPERFQGGFGLTVGHWFGDVNKQGIEASLFTLGGSDRTFEGFAPGMLVLFPRGIHQSIPQVIIFPPGTPIAGTFPATISTGFVGADVNYRHNLYCSPDARLDLLAGYRFAHLQDELYVGESQDSNSGYRRNRVAATNQFHGGQLGLTGEYRVDSWYVSGVAKVAFGAVNSNVSATGLFVGAEGAGAAGGFTGLPALGDASHGCFAVLPTVNVMVGKQIREHTRIYAGYSFQYLSQVTRLGDALSPAATTSISTTAFWVQAVNFGVELRY